MAGYDEKKDQLRREALAEEKARLDSTSKPPPKRILPPAREGELSRIHPDDLPALDLVSDERLKREYAPTLAEFERLYVPLEKNSRTRAQYLRMESASPAKQPPPGNTSNKASQK